MRKNFRFALEIDGINHLLIQEITPPTVETAEITHGSPGNIPDGKTAGKLKVGDLVIKKCKPEGAPDTWAFDWLAKTVGQLHATYAKPAFLVELGPDAITSVDKFFLGNVWVKKIDNSGYNSKGDGENLIETITLSVQYYYPQSSIEFTALFGGSAARAGGLAATLGKG